MCNFFIWMNFRTLIYITAKCFIYVIIFGCLIPLSDTGQRNQIDKNLLKPNGSNFSKI